jgi:hypothetical protein
VWNSILTAISFAVVIGLYAEYVDNAATAKNLKAGQAALIFSFFVGPFEDVPHDSSYRAALRVLLRGEYSRVTPC